MPNPPRPLRRKVRPRVRSVGINRA
jgi:hypothetical protein